MAKTNDILLKGTAYWAHVVKPEEYEGKEIGYSIMVKLADEEANEKLKTYLENYFKANLPDKPIDAKTSPNLPFKEISINGVFTEAVKAKTTHYFIDKKTGQRIDRKVAIFKADGTPLEDGTLIGNGSQVQVSVTPSVYHVNKKNFGITLRIRAVMVSELVAYGAKSAQDYGFEITESPDENTDEVLDGELEF